MAENDASLFGGYCLMNLGTVRARWASLAKPSNSFEDPLDNAETYGDRTLIAHVLDGNLGSWRLRVASMWRRCD